MLRYVILEHDHPELHWDFMLESGALLQTWRLAAPPQPARCVPATPIGDHRLVYLQYEGPVSGGRGRVLRWDSGTFTHEAVADDRLVLFLDGGRLRGRVTLENRPGEGWSLAFESTGCETEEERETR